MEHVHIITKEAITRGLVWPPVVIACIAIFLIIFALCYYLLYKKDPDRCTNTLLVSFCCIPAMLLSMLICTLFFPVETGRHKYSGTLDDDMTIVEYKEFQDTYTNITYKDGIWHWEDRP